MHGQLVGSLRSAAPPAGKLVVLQGLLWPEVDLNGPTAVQCVIYLTLFLMLRDLTNSAVYRIQSGIQTSIGYGYDRLICALICKAFRNFLLTENGI